MKTVFLLLFFPFAFAHSQSRQPASYVVAPRDSGMRLGSGLWKLTTLNTNGSIALVEFKNNDTTGWNWVPSHVHTREDEIWYVMEGELTFRINDQLASAGPGSVVFGPRNTMHAYRISKAPVKYLMMLTPAGIDRLFLEVDSVGKLFPRGSAEFIERIAQLSANYGSYHRAKWDSISKASTKNNLTVPGRFQQMLARSNGNWTGEGTMWFSPEAPPVKSSAKLTNTMAMNGRYQVSEITAKGTGAKLYTGVRITGYDEVKKVFTRAMIGDSPLYESVSMEGAWDEKSQSITMPFKQKEQKLKEVYSIIDENTELLEIYSIDEKTGKEFKRLSIKWTRDK